MTRDAAKLVALPLFKLALTWSAPVIVFALICWGTLAAQDPMPKYFGAQDKLEHLFAFGLLGGVLTLAAPGRALTIIVVLCVALSVGVEFGQAIFTLHREPSLRDASASVLGSLLGIGTIATMRAYFQSRGGLQAFLRG